MTLPFVTCVCPTFNRAPNYLWLLDEAVESFRRQDYPSDLRELIILNDAPGQTLSCDVLGVRVANLPSRVPSLGQKYNDMIALARGSLICPWEDDDISLPDRISTSVEAIGDAPYWNPKGYYLRAYSGGNGNAVTIDHSIGVSHNASIFTRDAWRKVNGYPHESGAQDAHMDGLLGALEGAIVQPTSPDQWGYLYRWGVQPIHLSGRKPHDEFYNAIGKQDIAQGRFEIVPAWKEDYAALCDIKPTSLVSD